MPRPLRIEYHGALYHVLSRGDHREAIFWDDRDRTDFLRTLDRTCQKTNWQAHAYCLMTNHFHLVIETPRPNLSLGMKWLLGTYTLRFNRRYQHWGHLFGGRYKAQLIDNRSGGYLGRACDYVHLNPARAGIVRPGQRLESYPWSSYPAYRQPHLRPSWLRVDRLLGEHGLIRDSAKSRREFERIMEVMRLAPGDQTDVRRSWRLGAEDFKDWLVDKSSKRNRKGVCASQRWETDTALAERLVNQALKRLRWRESDLITRAKGDRSKIKLARQLRTQTPMTYQWIADRLHMGGASYVFNLLCQCK